MIIAKNVHKSFGNNHVLNGLNLEIHDGEVLVIMGCSGSGKSVLLKHFIGLLKPEKGEITLDGADMTKLHGEKLYDKLRDVGMIFQMGALFDSMTVFENVAFYLTEHMMRGGTKIKRSDIEGLVETTLESVGLPNTSHLYPSSLSGGMKKRVSIARSIIFQPRYLLYDEPTTGLDLVTANIVGELIVEIQKLLKGTSVIVSHDVVTSLYIADRIALIEDGQIEFLGRPEEFMNYDHPTIDVFRRSIGNDFSLIRNR